MGLMGSLFGGAVGFALGGPLGLIAGAALGHGFSSGTGRSLSGKQRAQATYFISVFSMLAKMARADGRVTPQEISVTQRFMREDLRLDGDSQRAAIEIFNAAKESSASFEEFAKQFQQIFRFDAEVRHSMLDLLTRLAMADGEISPEEHQILASAASIFEISAREAEYIFAQHGAGSGQRSGSGGRSSASVAAPKQAYAILGVEKDADMATIKSSYRKLVTEFHPDKIMAKGLPEEFVNFAEQRFREIQSAYEQIKEERGIA